MLKFHYFSAALKEKQHFLGHIESLRAIAALIVVAFHFITFEDAQGALFQSESLRHFAEFGAQGVELFYIISGFVIYYSLTSRDYTLKMYPRYLLKRFLRIFPPFLGAILLICLTPFIWKAAYPYSFNQIVQNATLSVEVFGNTTWLNPIFATLKVEFLFYLIIGFLVVFMTRSSWFYLIINGFSLILVLFFPTIDLVHNIPFFLIGIASSQIYRAKDKVLNYSLIAACLLMIAFRLFPEDFVIAVIAIVFLLWIRIKSRFLERIGEFSYSLYLVHGLSGGLVLYVCKSGKLGELNPWLTLALSVTTSMVSAYVFFRIVEKRAMTWSKGIINDEIIK